MFDWNRLQELQLAATDVSDAEARNLLSQAINMLSELRNLHWNFSRNQAIFFEIAQEMDHAEMKFGPLKNGHEGYGVLMEEVDELWDAVKQQYSPKRTALMRKEATQVGAMAARFMKDVCSV